MEKDAAARSGQTASDAEVEMATVMLRIASDIDRLDDLTEQHRSTRLVANVGLLRTAEDLRAQVEQAAHLSRCPVLLNLVQADRAANPRGWNG